MDDVLTLITTAKEQDANGVWREIEQEPRQVFCHVRSVSRSEFFQAGRNGLNPAFVFVVFAGDYSGETLLEYRGQRYGIYRTYHVPEGGGGSTQKSGVRERYDFGADYLELYAERKGGVNGKNTN